MMRREWRSVSGTHHKLREGSATGGVCAIIWRGTEETDDRNRRLRPMEYSSKNSV